MNTKNLLAILALVIVVMAGGAYAYTSSSKTQEAAVAQTTQAPTTPVDTAVVPPVTAPVTTKYKSGTYSATGEYRAPSGTESVDVSLSIKDDVVVDSTVTGTASNHESKQYQSRFIAGYKSQVTGKKLDEINISNVSGSSLTPMGFNVALDKIKSQAKA
jgi:hypothetical protein